MPKELPLSNKECCLANEYGVMTASHPKSEWLMTWWFLWFCWLSSSLLCHLVLRFFCCSHFLVHPCLFFFSFLYLHQFLLLLFSLFHHMSNSAVVNCDTCEDNGLCNTCKTNYELTSGGSCQCKYRVAALFVLMIPHDLHFASFFPFALCDCPW